MQSYYHTELQPVTSEELTGSTANSQTGARLDIAANGVWGGTFERTYFDVRAFNPHAPSDRYSKIQSVYTEAENLGRQRGLESPHFLIRGG